MLQLKNDRLIKALTKQTVDVTPVWIMRQAGRYLPEYRATREKAKSFLNLCKTPELACEVTLQPLKRFDLDASIIFSDILTIPDAMGLDLRFVEGEGPQFANPITSENDIKKLRTLIPDQDLAYVMNAIKLVKHELADKLPLIGFSGSPWTLATYMVEGGASKQFNRIKSLLYNRPDLLQDLLSRLTTAVTDYLNAQIAAGVNAVMIFDTWGGILSTEYYRNYSLAFMQKIIQGLKRQQADRYVPVILFTKNGSQWLSEISETGCDAVSIDWSIELSQARQLLKTPIALQGNLDPAVLYANPSIIKQEVGRVLESYGANVGHVFNLGHGIYPDINPDHVAALVDAVHELSQPYHNQY
jgi:uroporphyrinogen decarboxylase